MSIHAADCRPSNLRPTLARLSLTFLRMISLCCVVLAVTGAAATAEPVL